LIKAQQKKLLRQRFSEIRFFVAENSCFSFGKQSTNTHWPMVALQLVQLPAITCGNIWFTLTAHRQQMH